MSDNKPVKESGHWYDENGDQVLEVPKKRGDGYKRTTLREARQMQLAPGVTTIIGCASAPALDLWKQRQAIMSALTLPRMPDETEPDWLKRVEYDMAETARQAAAEGTRIHAAIERAMSDQPYDAAYTQHVLGVVRLLHDLAGPEVEWEAEKGLVHPLGYGTKADLHDTKATWCLDFKGTDGDLEKLQTLRTYERHWMQLAATRACLESGEWGYPHRGDRYEGARRRCAIIYVSRTHPGDTFAVEVTEEQLAKGWSMFQGLLRYWQAKSAYKPSWAELA